MSRIVLPKELSQTPTKTFHRLASHLSNMGCVYRGGLECSFSLRCFSRCVPCCAAPPRKLVPKLGPTFCERSPAVAGQRRKCSILLNLDMTGNYGIDGLSRSPRPVR